LGYMPGVGIETGLSDHVSLRAQYTYTFYPSFSHEAITYPPPLHNGKPFLDVKTKVTPGRGLFTVMLSYLFNT
jgi:opacity protein-like surface antigen